MGTSSPRKARWQVSMLLKGRNGNEFELAFIKEEQAGDEEGIDRAGWVTVSFRAATADESWEETAPCLSLYEFRTLAEWLEALGQAEAHPEPEETEGPADREASKLLDETRIEEQVRAEEFEAAGETEPAGELSEVELLEPELKFTVTQQLADAVTIRVAFHLENRPEEFNVDAPTDEAPYIDLHMTRPNIRAAAESLRDMLHELELEGFEESLGAEEEGFPGEVSEELGEEESPEAGER